MNTTTPPEKLNQPGETASEETAPPEPAQPKRSFFQIVFLSPQEPRLRAGWRLTIQFILLVTLLFGLQYIIGYYLLGNIPALATYSFLISEIIMLFAITGSVFVSRTIIDNRSFASLGLKINPKAWLDLAVGIGIAALMMGIIFLAEWALGWLTFQDFAWNLQPLKTMLVNILLFLGIFIIVGWQEELLTRGYWLQNLEDGLNIYWAVAISSLIFSVAHLANPNFSIVSLIGLIVSGLFLAYGYISTRQLWLPIGLHIGWNFFEGNIFGFPVSGLNVPRLIVHTVKGPILWTGGSFGPEAGLILLPALAIGAFFIWTYTQSTGTEISEDEDQEN
ncbi:MAG: hypothetical protein MAG431_01572 [Chloroflexi bacterium]|nr:hypothetical protein [Chloroflexota bacterium]